MYKIWDLGTSLGCFPYNVRDLEDMYGYMTPEVKMFLFCFSNLADLGGG